MNQKSIIRLCNIIGIVSILLLLYWVFVYISMEVFGFKVFERNITDTFYASVIGILSLMSGALMINIMLNLTRIANKHNADTEPTSVSRFKKPVILAFVLSFPLIFAFLYAGDKLTANQKKAFLISSAKELIQDNPEKVQQLSDYIYNLQYLVKTDNAIRLLSEIDENFPSIAIVVADTVENTKVFLKFGVAYNAEKDTVLPDKKSYLFPTSKDEKAYLLEVFTKQFREPLFSAYDGKYELYYPFLYKGKMIVLYFSDHQYYGKIGS
jgi:hypothetical protein